MPLRKRQYPIVFLLGSAGYGVIEILYRKRTHWTMLLLGGVCFSIVYLLSAVLPRPRLRLWLLCSAVITAFEFLTGCLVNLVLGWRVWDYSRQAGNILGQICPLFSAFWFFLSIPLCKLSSVIRGLFASESTLDEADLDIAV